MNIECTPEEARWFLGLPDVIGLQEEMMEGRGAKIRKSLTATDPKALMRTFTSVMGSGFDAMQIQFWSQFTGQNMKDSE